MRPFIPRDLQHASMVLVRHDGVCRPLQNPYDGPYPVLESGEKVFRILRNGLPYTVSIDRLKACNMPITPPFSSIIPNKNPPPPHPPSTATSSSAPTATPSSSLSPPSAFHWRPQPSSSSDPSDEPQDPTSDPLGLQSETEFPALQSLVYSNRGRKIKPRTRLDL